MSGSKATVALDASLTCDELSQQIQSLNADLADLELQLQTAVGDEKRVIARAITRDTLLLAGVEAQYKSQGCSSGRQLAVRIPAQEQTYWCWVAAGSGIANFYDNAIHAQCAVVTEVFQTIHPPFAAMCCDPVEAPVSPCNGESGADQALDHPNHHFNSNAGALSGDQIVAEIDAGRPFAAHISFPGASHFVVVTGYSGTGQGPLSVYVQDPAGSPAWYTMDAFSKSYNQDGVYDGTTLSQP